MVIIVDELLSLNVPAITKSNNNVICANLLNYMAEFTFGDTPILLNTIQSDPDLVMLLTAVHDRFRMQFGEVLMVPSKIPAVIGFAVIMRYTSKNLQILLRKYIAQKNKDNLHQI